MKVLIFTSHYPAKDKPTRGTYNRNTFAPLAKHHELRVVGVIPWWYQRHQPKNLVVVQHDRTFGIDAMFPTYWSIPEVTFMHATAMYASSFALMRRLRREFAYDAIISTWAYPDGVVAARLADDVDCPLITAVLGTDVNELPAIFGLKPQIQHGLRRAQRVVAVSRAIGERVVELGVPRERLVVQRNGVDGSQFAIRDRAEARARLGLSADRPSILFVGNVQPPKGVEVLVEAMHALVRQHGRADVELSIVGSGADQQKLEARTRELGLGANIVFRGRRPHDEIASWMTACDVLCLPSHMEGCPNVVLEALASGRPVVASQVGGVPELLTGQNGIMAPAGDAPAFARALDDALGRTWDPEKLRGSVEYLSWDAVAETYRRLLDEVTDEWKRR